MLVKTLITMMEIDDSFLEEETVVYFEDVAKSFGGDLKLVAMVDDGVTITERDIQPVFLGYTDIPIGWVLGDTELTIKGRIEEPLEFEFNDAGKEIL